MPLPLVAIVGRPNVGKSTLFNRLAGRREALVTDEPGMTRDRLYRTCRLVEGRPFRIVDTGGLTPGGGAAFAREIETQAAAALDEAAAVLLVLDVRAGVTPVDAEIVAMLRRRAVPVVVVANKTDSEAQAPLVHALHEIGLGEPVAVSAEHALGIDGLLARITSLLPSGDEADVDAIAADRAAPIRLALVGRPNVGKSSILNRLLGEERVVVSELPGTTRDAVDTLLRRDGRDYLLIDTAGIRRRGRIEGAPENLAVVRARQAIDRSHVVALILDGSEEIAAQDAHIAGFARDAGRPVVAVVNKWDVVENREREAKSWEARVRSRLRFLKETPVLFVSAKSGQRVSRILDASEAVHAQAALRVRTPDLNRWLREVAEQERSAPARGRSVRLLYVTQTGVHPPRFVVFCNDPESVHFSLVRHLENTLRERFGFGASPIRLDFRSRRSRSVR